MNRGKNKVLYRNIGIFFEIFELSKINGEKLFNKYQFFLWIRMNGNYVIYFI